MLLRPPRSTRTDPLFPYTTLFRSHTGMLAHLTGCKSSWMLLASKTLNVIHVSTHVSLKDAISRATPERVFETIRAGHRHLVRMGIEKPRIAVARSEEHTSELQSLMRISYAVFCLKKKKTTTE